MAILSSPSVSITMDQVIILNIYDEPIPVYEVKSPNGNETFRNYDDAYRRFIWLLDKADKKH